MTNIAPTSRSSLDLYELGQQHDADSWLVSDWNAGQSSITQWSSDNVRVAADGDIELMLSRAAEGSGRPYQGGEIQGSTSATTGTWSWTAQAPDMVPGAVFGMFTYKSDWQNQPWVEFDFEFVGKDTTKVHLGIHMEDAKGNHVIIKDSSQDRATIDLGFDASEGEHVYEVTVTEESATFYIDGAVVAVFSGEDMVGGVWNIGPMNSYVDLWAVDRGQEAWAGEWKGVETPLVASVSAAEIRPGEYDSNYVADAEPGEAVPDEPPVAEPEPGDGEPVTPTPYSDVLPADAPRGSIVGRQGNDALNGNSNDNTIFGFSGNDIIDGKKGADTMYGMTGDDIYFVDHSSDRTIEQVNGGHDVTHAGVDWILADHVEDLFLNTDASIDGTGNAADNQLVGNQGSNILAGLDGADTLEGNGGNDMLIGGKGTDTFSFVKGDGQDTIADFEAESGELIEIRGYADYLELSKENGGTRIMLSDSDSIFLEGVASGDLSKEDFLFG